jgi:hypothetical protein
MKNFRIFIAITIALIALYPIQSMSQTQSDQSDAVWSIVIPVPASQNIDMKQCLVNSAKDSVITGFVTNAGSCDFSVDSIYFTGADAGAFKLVSGIPKYELSAGTGKATEFRFIPSAARVYTANIVIITQTDTLTKTITGEGVSPKLEIIIKLLDFGQVELGNYKTYFDTVLIKNVSGSQLTINNVVQLGPDTNQFSIEKGGGSFTLLPNATRPLTVKFKPVFGGRTSGQLGFQYNGTGSPAKVQLFGTGVGGAVFVTNDSAFAGESRTLKLVMSKVKPEGIAALASNFEAIVRFNKTILAPQNNPDWKIVNDSNYVTIKGQIGTTVELAQIPVIAGLGTVEETSIDIVSVILKDNAGNKVDYDFETESGNFKLLGICKEGGKRLINPDSKGELIQISPNPSDGKLLAVLNLIEEGNTILRIYDNTGNVVYEKNIESVTGKYEFNIETSKFGNGIYFVSLQTPTVRKVEKLIIFR